MIVFRDRDRSESGQLEWQKGHSSRVILMKNFFTFFHLSLSPLVWNKKVPIKRVCKTASLVVAQLAERSLALPEDPGSCPAIANLIKPAVKKRKNEENFRPGNGPVKITNL